MKRVTGIGGIFFKSKDPKALGEWYRKHLGLEVEDWGGTAFKWVTPENPTGTGTTTWSPLNSGRQGRRVCVWQVRLGAGSGGAMKP